MKIIENLKDLSAEIFKRHFNVDLDRNSLSISETKKEFAGDYTLVTFPLARHAKLSPEATAEFVGNEIVKSSEIVSEFNVVKGFLNLSLSPEVWPQVLSWMPHAAMSETTDNPQTVMVEYSSPNTNKPLHLGHVRNILLGWSMVRIFEELGHKVIKTQIANDRGIAICKSMVAWKNFGHSETPESTNTKGDHFVGSYYVLFEKEIAKEYSNWQETSEAQELLSNSDKETQAFFKEYKNTYFNVHSALGLQARDYLQRWEDGDEEIRGLWRIMNDWVLGGFDESYATLGVDFDKVYFESDTYLLGKEIVEQGLEKDVFYKKDDSSVWVDLEAKKLDHKLVLRSDGTSVYITQDLGTAQMRHTEYGFDRMIYVVANEQDYHFKVLFETLKLLGEPYADGLHHLSYGMVDLPEGRMKTREGTVVDADDLVDEMKKQVRENSEIHGGLEGYDEDRKTDIFEKIALGALKFFILKVNAKKRMIFNPAESVDLQGHTGPYVQNAYVRIQSILRKAGEVSGSFKEYQALEVEKQLIKRMLTLPEVITTSMKGLDPSQIANFAYDLAKDFHKFYHDAPILNAKEEAKHFRLALISEVSKYLEKSFDLIGISMPERM